jgi:hypothetical protein
LIPNPKITLSEKSVSEGFSMFAEMKDGISSRDDALTSQYTMDLKPDIGKSTGFP